MHLNKTIILVSIMCLLTFNGCNKFLEEEPQTLVALEELDENIVESLLVGMYEPLTRSRGRLWESHWGRAFILVEEHAVSRLREKNEVANYHFESDPYLFSSGWPTIYESINRANILLKLLNDDQNLEGNFRNEARGEACFIRAFNYFQLVRIFGEIPLRIEPVSDSDDANLALSSIEDVYSQIIMDMTEAVHYLPLKTDNPGRATKGAAETALADIFLTLKRYGEARELVKYIIDNKNLYEYNLLTSFDELYSPTSPTNEEDIFSLKFSRYVGQGSFLAAYGAPLSHPEVAAVRAFEDYGANSNAPLLKNWNNNDLRKALNIYNTATINGELVEIEMAGDYTHVYGKHRDPGQPEETASGVDYYLYRYADVLLIFAETENLLNGPTPEAYNAVNRIRRRAYGVDVNTVNAEVDLPADLSRDEFDELIFRERGYEFMNEGKRWFDLKRTGRWATIIPEAGKDLPKSLYWPFPGAEILHNEYID